MTPGGRRGAAVEGAGILYRAESTGDLHADGGPSYHRLTIVERSDESRAHRPRVTERPDTAPAAGAYCSGATQRVVTHDAPMDQAVPQCAAGDVARHWSRWPISRTQVARRRASRSSTALSLRVLSQASTRQNRGHLKGSHSPRPYPGRALSLRERRRGIFRCQNGESLGGLVARARHWPGKYARHHWDWLADIRERLR